VTLRCHAIGHSWIDVDSTWKPQLGLPLTVRCERCGTERRDTIARSDGKLLSRRYDYSKGYKYPRGQKPSRGELRVLLYHDHNKQKGNR
jgi:hypothetical protein